MGLSASTEHLKPQSKKHSRKKGNPTPHIQKASCQLGETDLEQLAQEISERKGVKETGTIRGTPAQSPRDPRAAVGMHHTSTLYNQKANPAQEATGEM